MLVTQACAPPLQQTCARATVQPLLLSGGNIDVLMAQLRQLRGLTLQTRRIARREFLQQQVQRGAIGDDVVHAQQQRLTAFAHVLQTQAQQRAAGQIEGFGSELLRIGFGSARLATQIDLAERYRRDVGQVQAHLAIALLDETTAQRLVTQL